MKRKRPHRCRAYSILNSLTDLNDFDGHSFMMQPNTDPIAWQALEYYASITPNAAQRQALLVWLAEHPCPGGVEVEQMRMELL